MSKDINKDYNYIENNPNYHVGTTIYPNMENSEFDSGILTGLTKEKKINKKLLVQCIFIDKKSNEDGEHITRSCWIPSEYISLSKKRKIK